MAAKNGAFRSKNRMAMLNMVAIRKRALATALLWLITRMEQLTATRANMAKIRISISSSLQFVWALHPFTVQSVKSVDRSIR
jgi:hypothetical protein